MCSLHFTSFVPKKIETVKNTCNVSSLSQSENCHRILDVKSILLSLLRNFSHGLQYQLPDRTETVSVTCWTPNVVSGHGKSEKKAYKQDVHILALDSYNGFVVQIGELVCV